MTTPLSTLLKPLNDTDILASINNKLGTINIDAVEAYEIVRQELIRYLHLPVAYYPNQYLLFKFENVADEPKRCKERIYRVLIDMAKEKPLAGDSCIICLDSIDLVEEKDKLMYVTEGHVFHTECMGGWVQTKQGMLSPPNNPITNLPLHTLDIQSVTGTGATARRTFDMGPVMYATAVSTFAGLALYMLMIAGTLISGGIIAALVANPRKGNNTEVSHLTNGMFRVSENNVSTSRVLRATLLLSFSCVFLAMFLTGAANTMAAGIRKSGVIDEGVPTSLIASNIAATIALGTALLFTTFVRDCLQYRDNKRVQSERQPLVTSRIN